MALPAKGGPQSCPLEGCLGRAATSMVMRVHFLYRHVLDTVVILEEVNLPHPWLTQWDMVVPRWALNSGHPDTAQCARGTERKRWWLLEEELRERLERAFVAYRETLENVTAFRYLGRVLTTGDDNWLAVIGNHGKARNSWGRLSRILIREGADLKVSGFFTKQCCRWCYCSGWRRG